MNDPKKIFSLRLRQYAVEYLHMMGALERVEDYEDDNFSPSKYTPSRAETRENLDKLHGTVRGYCIACDDVFDRGHGRTEALFWDAIENNLAYPEPIDVPDADTGFTTFSDMYDQSAADKKFSEHVFRKDE